MAQILETSLLAHLNAIELLGCLQSVAAWESGRGRPISNLDCADMNVVVMPSARAALIGGASFTHRCHPELSRHGIATQRYPCP
ncbi:MAG: hypothetical protein R2932_09800 [Caldilineaceae bacterium]